MYEFLREQLDAAADLDIATTPNFRAMLLLRDRLIMLNNKSDGPQFSIRVAAGIAARTQINLSGLENNEQVAGLVVPFAEVVYNLVEAMLDEGFSVEDIYAMAERDLKLELT